MSTVKVKGTVNFEFFMEHIFGPKRYLIFEGSTRSSKTYSIVQGFILLLFNRPGTTVTCFRKEERNHVGTTQKDIREIILAFKDLEIPLEISENKQNKTFTFSNGSMLRLCGTLEPGKLHGIKQDIAWFNEVMEISYDSYKQISQRTKEQIIFDFNPSLNHHWLFSKVMTQESRVAYKHSTFEDNPFLSQAQKDDIYQYDPSNPENIKNGTASAWHWDVYGLGKRGKVEGVIYTNWEETSFWPGIDSCIRYGGGLDFGFHPDPAALIECRYHNNALYLRERLYETNLLITKNESDPSTPSIQLRLEEMKWDKNLTIYADSAQPGSIQDLRISGYNMQSAVKGKDSIMFGINIVKSFKLYVHEDSLNLKRELEQYQWKRDPQGEFIMGKPIDKFNHLLDPLRYWARSEAVHCRHASQDQAALRKQLKRGGRRKQRKSMLSRRITR